MNIKKILLTLSFLFTTLMVFGQGFSYTYTDPCTNKIKELFINNPNGNVALMYYGQVQSFTPTQLQSGALEQWITQINSSNPSGPCSGVALYQNTTMNAIIAANNIAVLTNVLSALSDISSMGGTNIGGIVEAKEKSNSEDSKTKPKGGQSTNGTTNGGTTQNNSQSVGSQGSNPQITNGTTNGNLTQSGGSNGQTTSNSGSSTINNQTQNNGTTNNNGGGSVTSGGNQTNSQSQTSNGTNQNSGGGNSGQGTTTSTTGGNTTNTGNSPQGGGQTTQSSVTTSNGGSGGNTNNNGNEKPNEDKMNDMTKTSSSNSAQVKSKVANAKQGGILLTGDIVAISSASGEEAQQFRVNMSLTKSNTDNTFVRGALLNFTSSINNSNITFFAGYRRKNLTSIIANSSMLNFEKDFFNTTSIMESYKYKNITGTLGVNYTTGNLGSARFQSLSALGGLIGTFKVTKKINNTTMLVFVYSPYVYYYEGLWYESGWLAVPFTAFDYRISSKFKLNLSFSGVQQVKDATLNYQVLLGAKALL